MDFTKLKIALVTDSMLSYGGSDRYLLSLLKLFPQAHIYTSAYNKKEYRLPNVVHTSFIQYLPLKRHLSFFVPFIFELFDFRDYDLVISMGAGPAKGIITGIYQPHIGVIFTPPRHLWDKDINTQGSLLKKIYKPISFIFSHLLRLWDINAIKRVDYPISISNYIKDKVKHVYKIDSSVIYPGVDPKFFKKLSKEDVHHVLTKYKIPQEYLITLSRLYEYKNIDWSIEACIQNKQYLVVIGSGPDLSRLQKISARSKYIIFLNNIPDDEVIALYSRANAFIFSSNEDFGYVTIEAMAQGLPILGYFKGATKEIVINNIHGNIFSNRGELNKLVSKKVWKRYNKNRIIERAKQFSEEKFLNNVKEYILNIYAKSEK